MDCLSRSAEADRALNRAERPIAPAYLAAGVREFRRVDLKDRCVYVSTRERPEEQREDARVSWTPPEGPGPFVLDVNALLEGVHGDG